MNIQSKLPNQETSIFAVMSALANEHNAINLSQGFPNYNPDDQLLELVKKYSEKGYHQYAPMAGIPELRQELANKVNRYYQKDINPDSEITITAGATQAIFTAISAFVKGGDEVIIVEPAYDCYKPAIELMGACCKTYQLVKPDFKIDWDQFAKLITEKTSLVIMNTPHNPTGSILTNDDLEALNALLKGTNIALISDEVYEHLVYDRESHASVLGHLELYNRSIATYSFGKTFHCTGWKMGYAIGPPAMMNEFRKVHQFNVFSVNRPLQHALAEYMSTGDVFKELSSFYQKKRDYFLNAMAESRFKFMSCQGTYFMTADYSEISDLPDREFAEWLTIEKGVAVIPVSSFNSDKFDDKLIRFCFAKTEDVLLAAAKILAII